MQISTTIRSLRPAQSSPAGRRKRFAPTRRSSAPTSGNSPPNAPRARQRQRILRQEPRAAGRLASRSSRARSSRCSAATAAAARRRSRRSWGWSRRAAARCAFTTKTSPHKTPFALAQRGIAFVPEDRRIFPNLTVGENLRLAALAGPQRPLDRSPHLRVLRSAGRTRATNRRSFRAASSRCWPSRGRWSRIPRSSCSTSRWKGSRR